jgi:cation/acetate symporter
MVVYVLFGGMVATTYVQIVKAVLVLGATTLICVMLLSRFGFNVSALLSAAADASGKGQAFLEPGLYFVNKLDLISLGLALALGTAGLPHIMMRFYTVPVAADARTSSNWVIGLVLVMTTVLGFGAAALVGRETIIAANKAGNSAAPLLALQLGGGPGTLGGEVLIAFMSAVTFATILAAAAGLMMAAASTIAYDLYTHIVKGGRSDEKSEVRVAKIATVAIGLVAILLALAAQSLNVAFLVGLAFAVAASANLPVILYSLLWRGFNATGAVTALVLGTLSAVVLVLVGPAVIGPKGLMLASVQPLTTLTNPGIVSIPIGFLAGWIGSLVGSRTSDADKLYCRAISPRPTASPSSA